MPRIEDFKHYIDSFNQNDDEIICQHINNENAWDFLSGNIPVFHCPDKIMEETYYFRWWVYRKHVKNTPDGFIITEFLPAVRWAGIHNSINAAAGHHIYEGRWLKDKDNILENYIRFWFDGKADNSSYSSWLCDAVERFCMVKGDFSSAGDLLVKMAEWYRKKEETSLHKSELFWSHDDRDAMEHSISGPGLRPTLNSYMYGEAKAISAIAARNGNDDIAEEFSGKAQRIKKLVQDRLWHDKERFFKVIPLGTVHDEVENWDFAKMDISHNARELIGYIPWCFGLPDQGYETAWEQLLDRDGFYAPFGPATAEQRHSRFMYKDNHQCLWNGPLWPFATSQTLTAMANLLNDYDQNTISRAHYMELLSAYARCHYQLDENRNRLSWLDENLDPFTGKWLSRDILESRNWPAEKGGRERGKDYNHSTFNDLIISGLIGIRPSEDTVLHINPLIPSGFWDYFYLGGVFYHGKEITILYDKDGSCYNKGKGFKVFIDGDEAFRAEKVQNVRIDIV